MQLLFDKLKQIPLHKGNNIVICRNYNVYSKIMHNGIFGKVSQIFRS